MKEEFKEAKKKWEELQASVQQENKKIEAENAIIKRWEIKGKDWNKHTKLLNLEWKAWCKENNHSCTAVPYTDKSKKGTKHFNSDDWIKWIKMSSDSKVLPRILPEEVWHAFTQISTLIKKIDVSREEGITVEYMSSLRKCEQETRASMMKVIPQSQHIIMFHFFEHLVDSVETCGSVRGTWCFRGEREIGLHAKRVKSYKNIESTLVASFQRSAVSRRKIGLAKQANNYIANSLKSPKASFIFENRVHSNMGKSFQ